MSTVVERNAPAKRSVDEKEARAVAEAARETKWEQPSFVKELFLGDLRMDLISRSARMDASWNCTPWKSAICAWT